MILLLRFINSECLLKRIQHIFWLASHAVWQRRKEKCHFISILWIRMDHIGLVRVISQFSFMAPCGYRVRWKYLWYCHYRQFPNENFAHFILFSSFDDTKQKTFFFHFDKVKHLNGTIVSCWGALLLSFFASVGNSIQIKIVHLFSVCCRIFFICRCDPDFYRGNKFSTIAAISNQLPQIVTWCQK